MSRFGWAYVSTLLTGAVANGPTNSIQFNSGSQILSGSSNFTFDPSTNEVILLGELTGSTLVISASVVSASTYLGIPAGGSTTPGDGDKSIQFNSGSTFSGSTNLTFDYTTNTLFLTGTLRADNLIVSSSQILKSGSTIFGDSSGDTHQFTGSMFISNTLSASSTLSIGSNSTLGGPVNINNGNLSVTAGNVSGSGQLQVGSNSTLGGTTTISTGNLIVSNGTISASSNIQGGGTLTIAGFSTLNDKVTITNIGLIVSGATVVTGANFQVLGGTVSSSNALQTAGNLSVATNATIGGNILGSGGFKAAYNTYNSNYNVSVSSYFNGINSIGGAVTASLDNATQYQAGQTLIFKDTGGSAGTNNILIKPSGSQTIDGASGGVRITTNSGSITLVSDGSNQFYIVGSI
jgi:hypothetical protein